MPQLDGLLSRTRIDDAQVRLIDLLRANHMRHNHKNNIVVLDLAVPRTEDVLQNRNRAQARNAGPVVGLLLVLNAAQDAGLALAQPDHLVHHALADDRLRDAFDGLGTAFGETSILIFSVTSWS